MRSYYFGLLAEYIVLGFYLVRFYALLAHRFKTYVGEIDIIARKSNTIIFVEVKARRARTLDVLSNRQRFRIVRAADLFLSQNPRYNGYDVRFDLVIINSYGLPKVIYDAWSR